jgi:hypothetical protein
MVKAEERRVVMGYRNITGRGKVSTLAHLWGTDISFGFK